MIVAIVIVAGVIILALIGLLAAHSTALAAERSHWTDTLANREAMWREERGRLIDRIIAKHGGEILAFDREAHNAERPPEPREHVDRPLLEGL